MTVTWEFDSEIDGDLERRNDLLKNDDRAAAIAQFEQYMHHIKKYESWPGDKPESIEAAVEEIYQAWCEIREDYNLWE